MKNPSKVNILTLLLMQLRSGMMAIVVTCPTVLSDHEKEMETSLEKLIGGISPPATFRVLILATA